MKSFIFRHSLLTLIIFLSSLIYYSCGDDSVVTPTIQQTCITGQISNWTAGTNKTLYAYVYNRNHIIYPFANCPVDAQGNFNLCLPALSDTTLLTSDSVFYRGCSGGNVTFNPPDGLGAELYNFKVKDSNNTVVGSLTKSNYDTLYPGAFSVSYVYTNKDINVSGFKYCSPDTLNFNGTALSGWTKFVKNCTRTVGAGTTYLYNTTEPPGAIWKYHAY